MIRKNTSNLFVSVPFGNLSFSDCFVHCFLTLRRKKSNKYKQSIDDMQIMNITALLPGEELRGVT